MWNIFWVSVLVFIDSLVVSLCGGGMHFAKCCLIMAAHVGRPLCFAPVVSSSFFFFPYLFSAVA